MPGLINLLYEVLESSKRNILVIEKLISVLESDIGGTSDEEENLSYNKNKIRENKFNKYESFNFREDNLSWEQPFNELNELNEFDAHNITDNDQEYYKLSELIPEWNNIPYMESPTGDSIDFQPKTSAEHGPSSDNLETKQVCDELITPLSKLSFDERDKLLFSMYQNAKNNVKNIIGVPEHANNFEGEVTKEADRLLQVWMEVNKSKV